MNGARLHHSSKLKGEAKRKAKFLGSVFGKIKIW